MHISPNVSLPIAAVLAAILVWYWVRLGASDVPRSRRGIRRTSLAMSFAALLTSTIGVSFVDPRLHQTAYVVTWATVIFILLLIMLTAVFDMFNSVRLQREYRMRMEIDAAAELHRVVKGAASTTVPGPRIDALSTNGERGRHGHGASS